MSPGPVRIGLVGAGRLAERAYVAAFALADGVELVAVADPVLERCRHVAPAARGYTELGALLDAGDVEAVVIASPAEYHVAHAAAVSARGLPVLVEKPPAPDLAGACALASTVGGTPWLGLNRRFEPGIARLRAQAGGQRVLAVHALFHTRTTDWDAHVVADDALLDLGPHCVDLVRWLSRGDVEHARAQSLSAAGCVLELELDAGLATVDISHRATYREAIEVVLAGGRRLRWERPGGPATRVRERLVRRGAANPLARSLARQLEAFAAVARSGDPGMLGGAHDGVAAMAVIAAARESARCGGAWESAAGLSRG